MSLLLVLAAGIPSVVTEALLSYKWAQKERGDSIQIRLKDSGTEKWKEESIFEAEEKEGYNPKTQSEGNSHFLFL